MNNFLKNTLLSVLLGGGICSPTALYTMERPESIGKQSLDVINMTGYPINIAYQKDSSASVQTIKLPAENTSKSISIASNVHFMRIYFDAATGATSSIPYSFTSVSYYLPGQSIDVDTSLLNKPLSKNEKRVLTVTYSYYKQIGYTLDSIQEEPIKKISEKEEYQSLVTPSFKSGLTNIIIEEYSPQEIPLKEYSSDTSINPLMGESAIIFEPSKKTKELAERRELEGEAKRVDSSVNFLANLMSGKEIFWIKRRSYKTLFSMGLKTTDQKKTKELLQRAIDLLKQQGYTQESKTQITNAINQLPFKVNTAEEQYYDAKIKEQILRRLFKLVD
ncbi:hypothetical protein H0W26_03130 [Candidatus Dependentiae bacterium]|nr:hypothetical protein [Candidatus Dependentiae bacterium]